MSERIVDRLELIEVEAEHGDGVAARHPLERVFQIASKHRAVRQVGQRIMAGKMIDLGFRLRRLGDVLMRRDPAAATHMLGIDLQHAAVHQLQLVADRLAFVESLELVALVALEIQRTLAGLDAITENVVERGSGLLQMLGQPVHLRVTAVADDQALVLIEHAQAVIHIIERDVETLCY